MGISFTNTGNLKVLQIGGGSEPRFRPNIDTRPYYDTEGKPLTDIVVDYNRPFSMEENQHLSDTEWDTVIALNVLEKVSHKAVPTFLQEIYRILKPGGMVFLVVADSEARIKSLLNGEQKDWAVISERLYGTQADPEDAHKTYLTPALVEALMTNAGFTEVKTEPYGEPPALDFAVNAYRPKAVSTTNPEGLKIHRILGESKSPSPPPLRKNVKELSHEESSFSKQPVYPLQVPLQVPPPPQEPQLTAAKKFDRHYFDGGGKLGGYRDGYRDSPLNELIFRRVMERKPESVLELGCARGYVLKRIQDAGIVGYGLDVSKHCQLTRVCNNIFLKDITDGEWFKSPMVSPKGDGKNFDLCYSQRLLEHIPEEHLPTVLKEMKRTCRRHLHGIRFEGDWDGSDKTVCTLKPKEWWRNLFSSAGITDYELIDHKEFEAIPPTGFPQDVLVGDGKLKINVGSFTVMSHHGWDNLDIHDLSAFAQANGYKFRQHDCKTGLPYSTGVVDLIYSSHFLEHLNYQDGLSFLRECRRVIRKDGAMRLIVPDAQLLTKLYHWDGMKRDQEFIGSCHGDIENEGLAYFDEMNGGCANSSTAAGKLYALLHENHSAIYDAETLIKALEETGWEARQVSFRSCNGLHSNGVICTHLGLLQILRETYDMFGCLSLFVDAVPKFD